MRLVLFASSLLFAIGAFAADKPIYQCDERAFTDGGCQANRAGQPVSSDTPISLYSPPAIDNKQAVRNAGPRRSRSRRQVQVDPCASIRTSLAQLKNRRRRGYSSDTEAGLDAREAALRQQLRELCLNPRVQVSGG